MKRFALFLMLCAFAVVACAPQPAAQKSDPKPVARGTAPDANEPLEDLLAKAIKHTQERDLLTTNGFWTVFHGILGNGPQTELFDEEKKTRINALDHICEGGTLRGLVFEPTQWGVDVKNIIASGVGQGHQDQFISEMGQWGMPIDRKMRVLGKDYTFADFTHHAKMRASTTERQELSWAITIVSQYYGTDHTWTNFKGEKMSLEAIVRYELDEPIDTAACGGTHRLFGLTWAYHLHLAKGGKTTGVWREVQEKLEDNKRKAKMFQNEDGSFSAEYLAKPAKTTVLNRRIGTTGHVLEWLALAMTEEELKQNWVQSSVRALSNMILDNHHDNTIEGGGLYHALHGMHLYNTRVYRKPAPPGLMMP